MSTNQLYIPDKICVGFQNRQGTYTGKLAYVIYYDHKGHLRKEKSWQSWRDKKIDALDFGNEPTEGFVLNKGVGGQRQSYGWNARNEYIRVYDPRDFEFEISVANLLFILREGDCSRGKGLEGQFVYAWDGSELVLLPVSSLDYRNSKKFTDLQSSGVKAKDLIKGASYLTKRQEALTYVGRFDYYFVVGPNAGAKKQKGVVKKHVFWDSKNFVYLDSLSSLGALASDVVAPDYAELVDRYMRSEHGSRVARIFTESTEQRSPGYRDYWYYQNSDGSYVQCYSGSDYRSSSNMWTTNRIYMKDGVLHSDNHYTVAYPPGQEPSQSHWGYRSYDQRGRWVEPTNLKLYAELESGQKFAVISETLRELQEKNDDEE